MQAIKSAGNDWSSLTLKLMGRVIRSPKQRVPVAPQKGPRSNKKLFEKKKIYFNGRNIKSMCYDEQIYYTHQSAFTFLRIWKLYSWKFRIWFYLCGDKLLLKNVDIGYNLHTKTITFSLNWYFWHKIPYLLFNRNTWRKLKLFKGSLDETIAHTMHCRVCKFQFTSCIVFPAK